MLHEVDRDGRFVAMVLFDLEDQAAPYAELGGRYYVFTEGDAYKVKRLRRNRDVRAAPCRVLGTVTGEWVSGTGHIIEDRALIAREERAFETKYGWQIHLFNFFSKLAGKYPKRAWLELTL